MMSDVPENLQQVRLKIVEACIRAGREVSSVDLIAVSKFFPESLVREAFEAGQFHFGESKIQEAEPKISALPGLLQWHFIGRLQRNKVRRMLQIFDVIHVIDSFRLAAHVNEVAKETGVFPQIFLQVNIGKEESKGGFEIQTLYAEMEMLLKLDRLEILGLMCIPPASDNAELARPWFVALRELRNALEIEFELRLPCLSMGMSSDFEVAIEEGSTHVRVGSAIFGNRSYRVDGELG